MIEVINWGQGAYQWNCSKRRKRQECEIMFLVYMCQHNPNQSAMHIFHLFCFSKLPLRYQLEMGLSAVFMEELIVSDQK